MARLSTSAMERRLHSLVRKHETPFVAVSRGGLMAQLARFRRALPGVDPFYAVKANTHPAVIETLARGGAGFDVASLGELDAALAAGARPDRIIFANTIKPAKAIAAAQARGVDLMTYDSPCEVEKIARAAPGARVIVRIKVPNAGALVDLSQKFGAEPGDALPLLIEARRRGLRPTGVSFHVGSQCLRAENFADALTLAAGIFHEAARAGMPLEILDIGGGFAIPQMGGDKDLFDATARIIRRWLKRLFATGPAVRVIAEPGRYMVGPTGTLVMRVIGQAVRDGLPWYYLDDGLFGALATIVFDRAVYELKVLRRGRRRPSTLAGPTCDGQDIIARRLPLPPMEPGDIVYVENLGAYSVTCATAFNGFAPPPVVMVP
jgi:ornithine decarboxylase